MDILLSTNNLQRIQEQVLTKTKVHIPSGVIVPTHRIKDVVDSVYKTYTPSTVDITNPFDRINEISRLSIDIIIKDIFKNLHKEKQPSVLDKKDILLGSFNKQKLQSHSEIKSQKIRPLYFFKNY